jgi:hypothetical protein
MFISKMSLPRRTFLRGVGATMALPLLEAMIPAATALAATPAAPVRRFVGVFSPNGMIMDAWTPETAGTDFELKPVLKPLEPFRDQMVVVTNLSNGPQRAGGHALAPTMFLTGVMHPNRSEGADIRAGQSIDQALAQVYGKDTLFPSLELVAEDFTTEVGSCEIGFSCAYLNTISWKTATAPLPMEVSPRAVFDRMFGGTVGNATERAARLKNRRSVLDAVSGEARRLQSSLGPTDRSRLDDYLTNVREIEARIEKMERQASTSVAATPTALPNEFGELVDMMYDLMTVAFQADITRVSSFMMARELSNIVLPEIGINEPHHALSHHQNKPERIERYTRTNVYHGQLVAKFLAKLKATPDGDGSLLDHSLVMWGCGMSNPNIHTYDPLPFVLAGGDSGHLKGGRHIVLPAGTAVANLHLTLAQRAGVQTETFGDSTGTIPL